jgi:hypothetical protein
MESCANRPKIFITPMPDNSDRLTISSQDPGFYDHIWNEFVDFIDEDQKERPSASVQSGALLAAVKLCRPGGVLEGDVPGADIAQL